MANNAGQRLSAEEEREYVAYANAGITAPEKFSGVVFENVSGSAGYRYPTAEEQKAAKETAEAIERSRTEDVALMERVRKEASSRGVAVPPPPAPEPTPMPPAKEK